MQNILVASDLSVRSDRAMQRAAQLTGGTGANLHIVHVVDSAMPLEMAETVRAQATKTLQDQLRACCPGTLPDHGIHVVIGDPLEEVIAQAINIAAELIVVGIHRERHYLDLIKQTTMERLIRASTVPVLLVSQTAKDPYAHVLCAVDMSHAAAQAVTMARHIAPAARLSLFHAYHVPYRRLTNPSDAAATTIPFRKQAEDQFAQWAADNALPADLPAPRFIDASPAVALNQVMAEDKPDLLALGAHSRSNLGRYVLGGFTNTLIRNPPCDLLVAR